MNANGKNLKEFWKQYKELEDENNRLKYEIKKLEEKNANEFKKLKEEFREQYKELKEENNRLKEIINQNIQNMLKEKIDNEQINEINDSKSEEKDNSIISFNPNQKEKSSLSSSIDDKANSISFIDAVIGKIKYYSFLNYHFVCKKCNKVPWIEFVDLNNLNYVCYCHENKNLGIDIIKEKSIVEFENDKGDLTKYLKCQEHHKKYHYYCKYCNVNLCRECLSKNEKHRYHVIYVFDFHNFETNEIIYNICSILNDDSKKLDIENIGVSIIVDKILCLFSVIIRDFQNYPNYSHFKIFQNALTFFKRFFSNADNNKIIESLAIGKN